MLGLGSIQEILKQIRKINERMDTHSKDTDERLDNIEKVMIAQEINLKEHMRRSDNLEEMLDHIKEKELKPLARHVAMVEGALKFIGVLGILASVAGVIARFFGVV